MKKVFAFLLMTDQGPEETRTCLLYTSRCV